MEFVNGLVSVIIPTYKRCDMLGRAIQSVLGQTYDMLEVLVVDDNIPGSQESANVKAIVRGYANTNKVFYIDQKEHINGAVARNVGIERSQAEFIAFLDDDEEWDKQKIEKQVAYLNTHADVDGVSCLYSNYLNGQAIACNIPYTGEDLQFKILTGQVTVHTSTFLCRHTTLVKSGGFNPTLIRHQDIQMFVDFLNYGRIEPICEDLVKNHIDSEINRPNVEKLILVKKNFFDVISESYEKYSKSEQMRIQNAHCFEIIFMALKQRKFGTAVKYLLKLKPSIKSVKDLRTRYYSRGKK